MKIALACTAHRGCRCLQTIRAVAPDAELVVFSHEGEEWEPDYYDELAMEAERLGAQFVNARRLKTLHGADMLICVGWRYMVSREVYESAPLGAWVFHDSMLPGLRGFSPTVWAVRGGHRKLGATLFRMTEEVDAGAIVGQMRVSDEGQPMTEIVSQITDAYLDLLAEHLPTLMSGTVTTTEQDPFRISRCPKWTPEDLWLNWSWPAWEITRHVRAFGPPYPCARTMAGDVEVRILAAGYRVHDFAGGLPGRVCQFGGDWVDVKTRDGLVRITDARPMDALRRLSLRLGGGA